MAMSLAEAARLKQLEDRVAELERQAAPDLQGVVEKVMKKAEPKAKKAA